MIENSSSPLVTPELLKQLRKDADLTQAELADLMGISEGQGLLSRYESGAVPIPLEVAANFILQISRQPKLGRKLRLMVGEPECEFDPVDPGKPYHDYDVRLRLLHEFITREAPMSSENSDLNSPSNLDTLVMGLLQLPRLVIAGRSDAGKSHVANCLIGKDALPTAYQPCNRIPIAVIHTDYRPAFVQSECLMMKGSFDLNVLLEETKLSGHLVQEGGRDLLFSKAIHTAADEQEPGDIDWAILFLDSEILRASVVVDTPGFSASDADTDRAEEACRGAEILIYCSPAIGCLNSEDILRLRHAMVTLPSPESVDEVFPLLANFLFVITHAGPQVSDKQLDGIQKTVAHRFFSHFGDGIAKRKSNSTLSSIIEEQITGCFVPFWGELESRHMDMRNKVSKLLREDFPRYRMSLADKAISDFRESASASNQTKIDEWSSFLKQWEESKSKVLQTEAKEPERKQWATKQKLSIHASVEQFKKDSVVRFDHHFSEVVNPDNVEKIIRDRFSDQQQNDAKNEIAALVLKSLQDGVANDLEDRSKLLAEQINQFLKGYSSAGLTLHGPGFEGDVSPGFDPIASFAGGLAGLATFGALAVWAATLGNLGGYIIIAQVVGLLSAIGIHTGGVAVAVAAIASLGGPVVLGLALAVLAAVAAFFWFFKSWQRRMAERLCEEFNGRGLRQKIVENIGRYWDDTIQAFKKGADALEHDWLKYLEDLKEIVNADSREAIQSRIDALERLNDFFSHLPWVPFRRTPSRPRGGNN